MLHLFIKPLGLKMNDCVTQPNQQPNLLHRRPSSVENASSPEAKGKIDFVEQRLCLICLPLLSEILAGNSRKCSVAIREQLVYIRLQRRNC
jgi:hypothetical protein